ncbi:two-component regulator propeller domain-containing protein [Dysgonomonas sp. 25]|uniref:two-component regulator propeller domain-containing protein n=1 Tax=Dysgonomonas sp. 25 TaxID=2302933 RepID=UPI0013D576B0|nr:two-component regulator propeller domain-containing protein [Dysgonomonas sp. 25]NDV67964.1 hybrid sensor histidine kinase/response regulator [Dysgonomonas sp. 25]
MNTMKIWMFLAALLLPFSASAQYEFSHLNNTNGLSSNQVVCIYKDSRGFMWFGTNMGLNRYDGININVYKHFKNDPASSPYDRYLSIQEDIAQRLWLTVDEEVYVVYDLQEERFTQNTDSVLASFGLPPNPAIIEISAEKEIYCYYRNDGIYTHNGDDSTLTVYKQGEGKDFIEGDLLKMKISPNYIWILHKDGVLERINKRTKKVDFRNTFFKGNMSSSTVPKYLFIDNNEEPWIYPGVSDKGTVYYDFSSTKWIVLEEESPLRLSNNFVRSVEQDKKGLIWIGTDHGGINLFDKKTKQIKVLKNNIYDSRSISQNSIISMFCDNDGIVWVGTYKNGVSYYHPDIYKFNKNELLSYLEKRSEVFDYNSIFKDSDENLWLGTNGQGLIRYNEQKKDITIFKHDQTNKNSVSSNIITSIIEDHEKTLWIGTFLGGLNSYRDGKFTHYQIEEGNKNSLSSKSVYGLAEDASHNLWIGTLGGGIDMLDASRKHFTNYNTQNTPDMTSNYTLSTFSDDGKKLYMSSDRGINVVNTKQKTIEPLLDDQYMQSSLSSYSCNNMIIDSRGLYWIATDKGLNLYNPFDHSMEHLTQANGLPSDEVVSLIEDDRQNIWAGTRNGLVCIYCDTFQSNKLEYYIAYFDEKDGLPGSVCNMNAIHKDDDGIIYVGLTKGYVAFHPEKISFDTKLPQVRLTNLLISNQEVKPNIPYKGRIVIEKTIGDLDELKLNYNETNFTLLFSALSYLNSEKNHYRYKLEGLDSDWTEIKNGVGSASYSNLRPGRYKLIVYASNGDNIWSEQPLEVIITVKPPFWLSWWAYLSYFLLLALLLRVFLKWRLDKQKREFEQAQKIMEADKTHELDELKIRFFTNISHEFKTPLTLILTPVEKLLKDARSEEQQTMLTIVYRNARNLLKMVNDILDFRRFDLNKMTLNLTSGNIIAFVRDMCQPFSSIATEKSINLTFTTFVDNLTIEFDPEKIEKIVTNLLSNAFKYTESGNVDVSIGIRENLQDNNQNLLSIKVSDTGIGIPEEEISKIFDRFYRIERADHSSQPGTGIGLHLVSEYVKLHNGEISIESAVGKGTSFTVYIPFSRSEYMITGKQEVIEPSDSDELREEIQPTEEVIKKSDISIRPNLPTLLIVDDNEDFCRFVEALFTEDYHVITANDGEEGYTVVLDQLPDIILCDVMMPLMDGYEFCRKVKGDIRTSHIPLILLTAKSSEENQYLGIEAGADDYISKPFNIDMLKLKISKIIERQKKLHTNFKKRIDISPSEIEIKTMDEKFVEKAIAIVEKNIGNSDFLVEGLCKEMAMSRVYFYKKILALTDKTPSEFIRFIRLKRAADLLEKSQMFVNEIAFQVGFNDPKYFRKYFKEEFGITPNEYKKNAEK